MTVRPFLPAAALVAAAAASAPASPPAHERPAAPAQPRAGGLMRSELRDMARDVAAYLKRRGESALAVGAFTGPAQMPSASGPGLALVLTEELKAAGLDVRRRAKYGLSGTYRPAADRRGPQPVNPVPASPVAAPPGDLKVVVAARLEDDTGRVVSEFEQTCYELADVATVFGLTYERPRPRGDEEYEDAQAVRSALRLSYDRPRAALDGTRVRAGEGSPFALEVLVKGADGQYQPRGPREEEGLAFVPIRRGEVYALRVTNASRNEVAVTLSIDGLNTFAFSDNPALSRWVVAPNGTSTVVGWYLNPRAANEFLITQYANSAVAELKADPSGIGAISAVFRASWPDDKGPPADEPRDPPAPAAAPTSPTSPADPPDATGRGKEVEVVTKAVKRQFGKPRAVVTLRYQK